MAAVEAHAAAASIAKEQPHIANFAKDEHFSKDMRARGGRSPLNAPTPARGGRGRSDSAQTGKERATASALEDLMRRRGVDEAWNALEEMQAQGTTTDKYTVSRMLMKTVGDGRSRLNNARVYRAISLVERFVDMQPHDVDEVLFNALLDTCGRLKDLPRLEATVQRMRDLKVTPSPVTLGILVKTYGQAGDIEKVLSFWKEMEKQREQANAVTYGCMIDACVKCGHLSTAVEIFTDMKQKGKHRNTILYTTLIKGYGLEKDLKSAFELFREMPRESVPYNTITYNSIIDACVKCGDLVTAEALLQEILDLSTPTEPDLITFSTLLKGYCHIGDLDKALQLAEAIKARGLRCDELVYNTLMDGCVKANDITAGVGLFEEMIAAGMKPSSITHSILARLYKRAGYEDDANEAVAQLYQHHGIERPIMNERGGKGARRGQRSPNASPHGSPMIGFGGHQRSNSNWSNWSDTQSSCGGFDPFFDPLASGATTPIMGSPHAVQPTGMFMPLGMPPPLPGMGVADNTVGFQGSPVASPSHLAYGEQGQMMGMAAMPAPAMPQGMPQGMPSLPAFPFNQQSADPSMTQFFVQPGATPPQPTQGWASPMAGPHVPSCQTQPAEGMMQTWAVPVNPQNMMAPPAGQRPGQAFFENFTPTNHQVHTGQNPFCM